MAEFRIVPLFDNMDRLIKETFILQGQHNFFYLDTLEIIRAYPAIGETHQKQIASQINQLKTMFHFNASRGALIFEVSAGTFEKLALQIWMNMDLWMTRQAIITQSIDDDQNYRLTIWRLLIPHFTEMGKREYEQMLEKPYAFYF